MYTHKDVKLQSVAVLALKKKSWQTLFGGLSPPTVACGVRCVWITEPIKQPKHGTHGNSGGLEGLNYCSRFSGTEGEAEDSSKENCAILFFFFFSPPRPLQQRRFLRATVCSMGNQRRWRHVSKVGLHWAACSRENTSWRSLPPVFLSLD